MTSKRDGPLKQKNFEEKMAFERGLINHADQRMPKNYHA
jgi:hypothetical protein